jgi:hypothetical protein
MLFCDFLAVTITQYRFQNDAQGYWQTGHLDPKGFFQGRQGLVATGFAQVLELLQGVVKIVGHDCSPDS